MRPIIYLLVAAVLLGLACKPKDNNDLDRTAQVELNNTDSSNPSVNRFTTGEQYLTIYEEGTTLQKDTRSLVLNISWDASWRDADSYDAAWVFIKGLNEQGNWQHLRLKSDSAMLLENRSSDTAEPEIRVSPDRIGLMINRATEGAGDNQWKISIGLEMPNSMVIEELKAFGLEMVHISEGAFELGTLKGERDRREVLTPGAGGAPYDPLYTYKSGVRNNYGGVFKVNSEAPIAIGKEDGNLYWIDANIPGTNTFSGIPEGELSESFPKGYRGFYQMKYELSQQEYCDFLNSLAPTQQNARDFTSTIEYELGIEAYRNRIKKVNGVFVTDRPNRPCNFISWLDGQAYADWAGLRHMTELEFEKSCRGPKKAIYREYVWGVNEMSRKSNMQYSTGFYDKNGTLVNSENGNEYTDGNIHASMFSYFNINDVCVPGSRFYDPDCVGCRGFEGGDGGRGPVRKGIFGRSSKGVRTKAGATFYGAMEMGGNLQEPVVAVGHPSGRKFKGSHGDGMLSSGGEATNPDWQPVESEYAFGGRGGCWKFHENHARTSDRFKGLRQNEKRRASHIGFRGVRTDF